MGSFSLVHWIVVIVILLLVFGPKRLSEVGKGLGQGIRNFKKGMEGGDGAEADEQEASLAKPKRVKEEGERSPRKLKAKRAKPVEDDDDDDGGADDEEEEARPRKKSKRA